MTARRIAGKIVKATKKAATTTAQQKVKREAAVDTRFSKKGYKEYMSTVDRKAFDEDMQKTLAKRAAKKGMSKKEANAMAAEELKKLQKAKKVDKRTDKVVKGVRKARDEVRAEDKAKRTGKKGTQGTGFRFATKKSTSEVAAGRLDARTGGDEKFAFEQEYGRGGKEKITEGKDSFPKMQEAASKGSRKRADKVGKLETKEEKGTITEKEAEQLKRLNKASKKSDKARVAKASITKSTDARKKARGEAARDADPFDPASMKISREKISTKDVYIGNTTNGIKTDGEILGNPTPNQVRMAMRDFDARDRIEAKKQLVKDIKAFIRRMRGPESTPAMRKAGREMEKLYNQLQGRKSVGSQAARKAQETRRAQARSARNDPEKRTLTLKQKEAKRASNNSGFKRGGLMKTGHRDMRKGGLFR